MIPSNKFSIFNWKKKKMLSHKYWSNPSFPPSLTVQMVVIPSRQKGINQMTSYYSFRLTKILDPGWYKKETTASIIAKNPYFYYISGSSNSKININWAKHYLHGVGLFSGGTNELLLCSPLDLQWNQHAEAITQKQQVKRKRHLHVASFTICK